MARINGSEEKEKRSPRQSRAFKRLARMNKQLKQDYVKFKYQLTKIFTCQSCET